MCLAAVSFGTSTDYPLVFAANRDELHERPTAAAAWWGGERPIYGGRDLKAGGSWLAVDRRGRLAAVTNFREHPKGDATLSRGDLVKDYLASALEAEQFLATIESRQAEYGPYNLLIFDGSRLFYASNRAAGKELEKGDFALSNARLGSDWPKVTRAETRLPECLLNDDAETCLFKMLHEEAVHGGTDDVTARGAGHRSTIFVNDAHYGTRCSTVVRLTKHRHLQFTERRYGANGIPLGETSEQFALSER